MNRIRNFFLSILALCVLSRVVVARPQPVFVLDDVEKISDLIVILRVLDIQQSGTAEKIVNKTSFICNRFNAACEVLSVLKGQGPRNNQLSIEFLQGKDVLLGMQGLRNGEIAVLFLKKAHGENFVFVDDLLSKIPMDVYTESIARQEGSVGERIGRQIIANLEDKTDSELKSALHWASAIKYTIPEEVLFRLSESTNPQVRAISLVPLIRQHKKSAINQAVELLLSENQLERRWLVELAWALERVSSSMTLEQANQLAGSVDPLISRIGIRILSAVGDESSVLLMLFAEAALLQSLPIALWMLVFFIANAIYFPLSEEKGLKKRFGDDYREYCAHVPRWIPKLRPWKPDNRA